MNREIGVGHAFGAATVYHDYWAIHATLSSAATSFADWRRLQRCE